MQSQSSKISRRHLIAGGAAVIGSSLAQTSRAQTPATGAGPDIAWEASIAGIRESYLNGDFTITEFVEASLARIDTYEGPDYELDAMISINPDAIRIAQELDRELKEGRRRGPMHGIPVVVKDIVATTDAMDVTAGARVMAGTRANRDAFIVEQMRNAGMIILGKANLTEWSGYRPVLYGWSPLGGLCANPNALTQTTWGSSSGSAAAVAASYAPVAIGVESDGSIICPSSACGVVGIKPTVSLTSRQGIIGNGYTLDSPGVMGRSVADAAALLSVIAGLDRDDIAFGEHAALFPAGEDYETLVHPVGVRDYTRAIVKDGLKGARIGVARSLWGGDSETRRHAENALVALADGGATIIDDLRPSDALFEMVNPRSAGESMGVEFPATFARFLQQYTPDSPVSGLQDVVDWYNANPDESQWAWNYDSFTEALNPPPEWGPQHLDWITDMTHVTRDLGINATMDAYELDALVCPTCSIATQWNNFADFWASSQLAANAGYPSITIPVGYSESMPAGLHFFGRRFSERKLIRYAAALEEILDVRQPPEFLSFTRFDEFYSPSWW